jgi:predicted Zn-dependent protease
VRRWRDGAQQGFETSLQLEPVVILVLVGMAIVGFLLTGAAARAFHSKQEALGREWFVSGEKALREERPQQAVEDFRNALMFERDNRRYRLRLAQALVAAGGVEEARTYLLNLWEREPGDATVNLELARIFGVRGDVDRAGNYYHNAIHGVWPSNPEQRRRETRLELVEFLLAKGKRRAAHPELMALVGELPGDSVLGVRVGNLCMRAQDYACAADMFGRVLREEPRNAEALKGAGAAAFQRGHYGTAQQVLRRIPHEKQDEQAQRWLRLSALVIENDPLQRRLSTAERTRRAVRAYRQSLARVEGCVEQKKPGNKQASADGSEALLARAREAAGLATEARLRRDPERREAVVELAFEMQRAAERECGTGGELDQALLLIARQHEVAEP